MKLIKFFTVLFFIILFLFPSGCSEDSSSIELTKLRDIKFSNISENDFSISLYNLYEGNEYLIALNKSIPAFNFFNIQNSNIEHSIPLTSFPDFSIPWYSAAIISVDSCLVLDTRKSQISLLDNKGFIKNQWQFRDKHIFSLGSTPFMPLRLLNGNIYCSSIRNNIRINTVENLKEYYNSPTNVILELISDTLSPKTYFGEFPQSYRSTTANYNDRWPSYTYNDRGEIILSFMNDHNLFVYDRDGNFMKSLNGKSKYIDNFIKMDLEKNDDFVFLKKYSTTEPKYSKIIFDDYRNMYYRIVKHKINDYENEDGTVKSLKDANYSIIFFDSELNLLDELIFRPTEDYVFMNVIPAKSGLLVAKKRADLTKDLEFGLFKLKVK